MLPAPRNSNALNMACVNTVSYTHLVILQMFHQTDLSLVLDGLLRRTVLAHTERVVRPDIDSVSYTHLDVYKRQAVCSRNPKLADMTDGEIARRIAKLFDLPATPRRWPERSGPVRQR